MAVQEIKEGELVLARHIPAGDAWGGGLKFFSPDGDYQQVGTWGYDQGKQLLAHSHNEVTRAVLWTQEVLYIRQGRVKAEVFDTNDQKVAELEAGAGDILVLLRGGHGYEILEDGTQVLEIKNGPYVGADADRRRLQQA
ncbi:hypothetical protein J7U46_00960 [Pelomonas sp. V22]|uniref:hypothetical protein n=1 Tax=Pelomonas sp. V22 TaxID=2822139 RepID=UPI0024A80E7E|nr:hypothetical protein [Pelomonas sp. V22]MDI4631608.1 hypothetical protein [Pelomonas sp. V22]